MHSVIGLCKVSAKEGQKGRTEPGPSPTSGRLDGDDDDDSVDGSADTSSSSSSSDDEGSGANKPQLSRRLRGYPGPTAVAPAGPASPVERLERRRQENVVVAHQLGDDGVADVSCSFRTSGQIKKKSFGGVYWHKVLGKWQSTVCFNKDRVSLGFFVDEADAAAAYDKAALLLRGREIELNFPLSNYLDAAGAIIEDQGFKERLERRG